MAKLELLEIVNDIANDIDTDPVSGIEDTVESVQIAQIIKTTYFELMANRNWPHLKKTVQLESVSDVSRPTHLRLPELTKELICFSYNKLRSDAPSKDRYKEIPFVDADEFLRKVNQRDVTKTDVVKVFDFGGAPIYIKNDKQPEYFTSFDDDYIVLDSYDASFETTLQNTNTQALIYFEPSWSHTDTHIPDMPSEAFPLLVSEAKSMAYLVLKQEANPKLEQRARRQNNWLSRKAWKANGGVKYPNYGRQGMK